MSNNHDEQVPQSLDIELSEEVAEGIYSNFAIKAFLNL